MWICYCLAVTGHPLPNTFYAKYSNADAIGGFTNIVSEIILGLPAMSVVGVVLFLVGIFGMIRMRSKGSLIVLLIPWVFLAGVALTRLMPPVCGDYFYWLRYAIPALPFLFVPIAMGASVIANLGQYFTNYRASSGIMTVFIVTDLLLLSACFIDYPVEMMYRKSQFAWNCQNINEVQVEIGRWVKRNAPRDAALLTIDAGAIRYFGERKTFDVLGLNNHVLLFDRKLLRNIILQPDTLSEYMRSQGATYYVAFPGLLAAIVKNDSFQKQFSPIAEFTSPNYTLSNAPQGVMVIYGLNR